MNITHMSLGDSFLLALVGILFVFAILAFLALVVVILAKVVRVIEKKDKTAGSPKAALPIATTMVKQPDSPTSPAVPLIFGGEVRLFDCDDNTAVLIMAIVADNTDIPLNELVFKTIKAI